MSCRSSDEIGPATQPTRSEPATQPSGLWQPVPATQPSSSALPQPWMVLPENAAVTRKLVIAGSLFTWIQTPLCRVFLMLYF
nr:hypothetical protein Iba_chr06fCG8160 [Ipomoea batatas]